MRAALLVVLLIGCKEKTERPVRAVEAATEQASGSAAASSPQLPKQADPKKLAEHKVRLNNTLLRIDHDHDGKVTLAELQDSELDYLKFDDPKAVDSDGDGTITVDEIAAAIDDRRAKSRARWEAETKIPR